MQTSTSSTEFTKNVNLEKYQDSYTEIGPYQSTFCEKISITKNHAMLYFEWVPMRMEKGDSKWNGLMN